MAWEQEKCVTVSLLAKETSTKFVWWWKILLTRYGVLSIIWSVIVSFSSVVYHVQVPCSMVVAIIGVGVVGLMVYVWSPSDLTLPVCVSFCSVAYHHIREVIQVPHPEVVATVRAGMVGIMVLVWSPLMCNRHSVCIGMWVEWCLSLQGIRGRSSVVESWWRSLVLLCWISIGVVRRNVWTRKMWMGNIDRSVWTRSICKRCMWSRSIWMGRVGIRGIHISQLCWILMAQWRILVWKSNKWMINWNVLSKPLG